MSGKVPHSEGCGKVMFLIGVCLSTVGGGGVVPQPPVPGLSGGYTQLLFHFLSGGGSELLVPDPGQHLEDPQPG